MNVGGRIAVCGGISAYGQKTIRTTDYQWHFLINQLQMIGFVVDQFADRSQEGVLQNLKWIQEGKLKFQETITEGFENMPDALIGVYAGKNLGKAIVKV